MIAMGLGLHWGPMETSDTSGSSSDDRASQPKTRNKLRQSEEHFAQLVAGVRDYAVFLLDHEGNVMTWNAGAEAFKGYRAEEIIGTHFSRFYTNDAISSGWPAHELKVAASTGRFEDEGWRVRKDGTHFWANIVLTALRDEKGGIRGFLKITRDLTNRKQAEEKLRLSEERFRLLVEGVKDYAIFMLDPGGRITTWNSGAENLKGYTASEIIGRHFSIFYPEEALARDWPAEELRRAIADGRIEDEGWRLRKDGSRFWANVVITALRDETGMLQGFAKVTRDLSDRKDAEEKTRLLLQEEAARRAAEESAQEIDRQREQLRVTLASIGDGVIVTDAQGLVSFLNPVAERLTAWSLAEAAGQPMEQVFRIVHEETRETIENPAAKALKERTVVALANHTVLLARDGSEVPIEDSAAPIVTPSQDIAGVVLVFRDVTEARRSLEARLYLAAIVESSDDAIIGKTMDGRIASWNRGAERLYGYTAQEIVGQPLALLVPPEKPEELKELMVRIRDGQRIENYETVRVRKDGSRVPVSLTISPLHNREGEIIGASKIARDITAQKEAERRLLRHSRRFKLLWESAAVLLATDVPEDMLRQLFVKIGPHLELDLYFNYVVQEGKTSLSLASAAGVPEETLAEIRELELGQGICGQVALTRQAAYHCHLDRTDDERTRYARELGLRFVYCAPLLVEDRLLGTLSFGSRTRPDFEADELEFLHTLSQYVTVAYERLRLVEQLREADRRKDHFLATLAHELRNPLAPIRNGLEVLKLAGLDSAPVQRAHSVMDRQLNHMVRLIDDLLDMSRISRGKITLQKRRIDLAEIVHGAIETSRPLIETHHHRLELELPSHPVWIDADVTRMSQVLSNLLNNAAKFTPEGGLIEVRARTETGQVVLQVRDSGVGIPASMLDHVFEVFTQVDRSLERSQGGLGIGLSLVKGLVELHGGQVQVNSEGENQGTEFIITLPLPTSAPDLGPAETTQTTTSPSDGRLRILIVDDNKDSAMTLEMMLSLMRQETRQAHDGVQALRVAEEYRPHLIIMDIGMPNMNGYDACRTIRCQEWGRDITIVALTGWGQEDDRRRSQEAGFDTHLVKPVEPAALNRLVQELAARHS